ncbi:MAG: hypothetical protein U0518_00930 [Candidatus Gracilibacteria bacterium]
MSPSIETQRTLSSENTLLEKLKSTLTARWEDFDHQLPAGKFVYPAYVNIKSSYEGLLADLRTTFTDDALKHDPKIQGKIDTFLTQLNKYLQKEDRDKKYDATLTETNRLVSELRNQIYAQTIAETQQKAADLKQDVVARTPKTTPDVKTESLPTTAQAAVAVAGGTGVVATIESGGKKAEEAVKGIMKPLEKIKKWSSDIGDAWDAGWELVKKGDISKGIGLFFAVLFGGNLKDALAKYTGKKDDEKKTEDNKPETLDSTHQEEIEAQQILTAQQANFTAKFLIQGTNPMIYSNYLGALYGGMRDATTNKDEVAFRTDVETDAVSLLTASELQNLSYKQIQSLSVDDLVRRSGKVSNVDRSKRQSACKLIKEMFQKNELYFAQTFGMDPNWKDIKIISLISTLYTKKGYNYFLQMSEKISHLSINNITDLPSDLFLDLKMQDGKFILGKGSLMDERFESFKARGLSPSLTQKMFFLTTRDLTVTQFLNTVTDINSGEKQFVVDMANPEKFLNPFRNSIAREFGCTQDLLNLLGPDTMTMKDLFEIYMITGGNPNAGALSSGEKPILSLKLFAYFQKKNPDHFGQYIYNLRNSVDKYPIVAQTAAMLDSILNKASYTTSYTITSGIMSAVNTTLASFGIDTTVEKILTGVAGAGVVVAAIKVLPFTKTIGLISLIISGLAVVGVAGAQQSAHSK